MSPTNTARRQLDVIIHAAWFRWSQSEEIGLWRQELGDTATVVKDKKKKKKKKKKKMMMMMMKRLVWRDWPVETRTGRHGYSRQRQEEEDADEDEEASLERLAGGDKN